MKYLVRAGLAVAMLVGFYLLAIGLAVGLGLAVVQLFRLDLSTLLGVKLAVLAVPAVVAIGYGVFFRAKEEPPHGRLVTAEEQPRLWALAREIAAVARTRDVDEIRLVPEVNASVSDSSTWLGLRSGTRRMFVGVPLLLALDEPQMRSVIAHEFGHYSGRHTTLTRITYRGAESIRRILSQLGRRNLVARVLRLYGGLYFAVSRSVNRRQELEADQLGARVAGADVMASALIEMRPASAAWFWYCHAFAGMGEESGRRPDAFLARFAEFLEDPRVVTQLGEVRDSPETEQPSVYDTHPSCERRVAALDVRPPVLRRRQGWAVDLLDAPDETLAALERDLYPAELVATPMELLAPLAAAEDARRHVRLVDDVLIGQGRAPGLRTVMQYLGNGMARGLVRRDLTPDTDADELTELTELTAVILGGYLAAALLDAGRATHRLDWKRGYVLVDPQGSDLDLAGLVTEVLAAPSRAAELAELLRLNGVAESFRADERPPDAPRTPDPETARILGVISPVGSARTFVVHDDGLVLLPERAWLRVLDNGGPVTVGALLGERGARGVPWERVTGLRRVQLAGGRSRVICDVAGEEPMDLRIGPRSGQGGEPFAALREHLGERYRAEERVGTRL